MKKHIILLQVFVLTSNLLFGQNNFDMCTPDAADSINFYENLNLAMQEYEYNNYNNAIEYLQNAERILPRCKELKWNLALCYYYLSQNNSISETKYLYYSKKYFEDYQSLNSVNDERIKIIKDFLSKIDLKLASLMGIKVYYDGRYYGNIVDDKPNGFGICYYDNDMKYEGDWKEGKKDGIGRMYKKDGSYYEGNWKNDKKHDLDGKIIDKKGNIVQHGVFINGNFDPHYNSNYRLLDIKRWSKIKNGDNVQEYLRYIHDFEDFGIYKEQTKSEINNLINQKWQIIDNCFNKTILENHIQEFSIIPWFNSTRALNRIEYIKNYMRLDTLQWNKIDSCFNKSDYYKYIEAFSEHGLYIDQANEKIKIIKDYEYRDSLAWKKIHNKQRMEYFKDYRQDFSVHGKHLGESFMKIIKIGANYSRSFFELTSSFSAPIGYRAGKMYTNHWGGYCKFQTSIPSPSFIDKYDYSDEYGIRSSISTGAIYALTNWLYMYCGVGVGLYQDSLYQNTPNVGGEFDAGLQFRVKKVSISAGVSYCKIGSDNPFLDYNIGIGLNRYYNNPDQSLKYLLPSYKKREKDEDEKYLYLAYNFDLGYPNVNIVFSDEECVSNKGLLGFSYGILTNECVGAYLSYRSNAFLYTHKKNIDNYTENYLYVTENDSSAVSKAFLTFGITRKIFSPLWVYFGIGGSYYSESEQLTIISDEEFVTWARDPSSTIWGINPEIGLSINLWGLLFRVGIDQTIPVNNEFKIDKFSPQFSFSLGGVWRRD